MVKVLIPSQLTAYTDGATRVAAAGETVGAIIDDLDGRYAGLRFRVVDEQGHIRKHMRIFVGQDRVHDLARPVTSSEEVMIFGALSGG